MSALVSPGVSISVIDQSITVGSGPGTVPLIFIATAANKTDPTGVNPANGTLPAYAGQLWSITSQSDLVNTFGMPNFYNVSGTPLNAYPLNEYGLLSAYSYLGIANLALVIRADIDLGQLVPSITQPTSPAATGTLWFNESALPIGSSYGLFVISGTSPNATWVPCTISWFWNGTLTTPGVPVSGQGVIGDFGIAFDSLTGVMTYYKKTGSSTWSELTSVTMVDVWPNANTTTFTYWVKTSTGAQGANLVLDVMNSSVGNFVQVESPILTNDAAAIAYYSNEPNGIVGQYYAEPVIDGVVATYPNAFQFRVGVSNAPDPATFTPAIGIIGSQTAPVQGPQQGQLWYNSWIGLYSNGQSTVDLLISNGTDGWINTNLPGFTLGVSSPTVYIQPSDPQNNIPPVSLSSGDLWIDTDILDSYPTISRWNGSAWILIDLTDQTSPNGIIFQDARPNPLFDYGSYSGVNNGGGSNPNLDPDAPDAALYPEGFLLWNTRYSSNNVKEWNNYWIFDGIPATAWNNSTGRWVTLSGNAPSGVPYMGPYAQQIVVANAMNELIVSNQAIQAEDTFLNLIAAPGYVECITNMITLNDNRGQTAFIVGDSPMTLPSTGTSLTSWATNATNQPDNNSFGLVSADTNLGIWYPSGLTTNPTDGTNVVVPPSFMALYTIAYNDQVAYPWFAPAGLQRGVVVNASSVGYVTETTGQFNVTKLNQGQRDILYTHGINPIRVMPNGGIVMYGQIDRQDYASSLDRINVARLVNYLRYQFNQLAQPYLFQPNDQTTWAQVTNTFNSFLSELITLRGVEDFLCVCDSSNNTPATIGANELWVDIAIFPVRSVEFIYIPIRIVNTGASLTSGG